MVPSGFKCIVVVKINTIQVSCRLLFYNKVQTFQHWLAFMHEFLTESWIPSDTHASILYSPWSWLCNVYHYVFSVLFIKLMFTWNYKIHSHFQDTMHIITILSHHTFAWEAALAFCQAASDWKRTFSSSISTRLLCSIAIFATILCIFSCLTWCIRLNVW